MKHKILLLRITFWWGLLADAVETIRMTFPALFKSTTGLTLPVESGLQLGLLYGMPVMLGWTLLLFWADRKPLARRGVLLCLIPVIGAYFGVQAFAISKGLLPVQQTILPFILQSGLLGLCAVAYYLTRKTQGAENENQPGVCQGREA